MILCVCVAIPPTFCVTQKLCKQNFLGKGSFRLLTFHIHTLPRSFSVGRSAERPIPYWRPLYMVVTVACHCCSIMYSLCMSNVTGEKRHRTQKKGSMKIKKQSPVISFATFISFGPFGVSVYVYVCICVHAHSRIDQLCTYYLCMDV